MVREVWPAGPPLSDFRGPKAGGRVTPGTLFRANALYFDAADPKGRSVTPPGVLDGPLISQFLVRDVPYGAQWIGAHIRTTVPATREPIAFRCPSTSASSVDSYE